MVSADVFSTVVILYVVVRSIVVCVWLSLYLLSCVSVFLCVCVFVCVCVCVSVCVCSESLPRGALE